MLAIRNLENIILAGIIFITVFTFFPVFARVFLTQLRRFPGPFAAKTSDFWLAKQCRRTRRSQAVMAEHRKHGDFVRIATNHISINNPQAVSQIYGHKTGFLKSEFYDAFVQVKPGVFNTRQPHVHQRKRKYMNPAFSSRALADFEPHMDEDILKWKNKLLNMATQEIPARVDFVVWTNFLAFDVIGSFSFGKSFGFTERGYDPYNLIHTIDTRGEVLNALGSLPLWIRPLMKYNYFDSFWSAGLRAAASLEKLGRTAYADRKETQSSRKDFLSYMLTTKDPDTKEPLQESEMIAESISFIVGGSDTTSSTMSNFIDVVSRNQTLQDRLQAEIDQNFPGQMTANWVPPNRVVAEMPLLNAILREVMRLRPTSATGLERVTPAGGRTIAGEYIPEGTIVSVPTCGLLTDERIFRKPWELVPERWEGDDVKELLEYFLPFSTGPRACIGRTFAWMEILKTLVMVFKLFNLRRTRNEPTVIKEGFFYKAAECEVWLEVR